MKINKIECIYWFAHYNLRSPSVRYRAKYPLEFFETNKNIKSYFVIPSYKPYRIYYFLKVYIAALFFRKKNSLIVIQRVQSNFIYANLLKILVKIQYNNTVYDIDDADYLEINPKTIFYFAKNCNKISAGSTKIVNHLKQYNNKIIHTTSPIIDLNIVKPKKNEYFTVGWVGGFGGEHKESLIKILFPALKVLNFNFKFKIIGIVNFEDIEFIKNYFKDNSNIELELPLNINWNDEYYIQKTLSMFDIGIATLTNSEMQLSKSGIKAKQYMNNGVPVLNSNLPENNTVVIDGFNGFFCDSANDFIDKINQFYLMSNEVYAVFSKNARASIKNFDHNKYHTDFIQIINT